MDLNSRNQRVEGEGIAEMLTTPEKIRTLQRKLYRKAKQEPSCRFHALYDKVYRTDILSHAYNLVRTNQGGADADGVTFKDIEAGGGAPPSWRNWQKHLKKVPATAGWTRAHALR